MAGVHGQEEGDVEIGAGCCDGDGKTGKMILREIGGILVWQPDIGILGYLRGRAAEGGSGK